MKFAKTCAFIALLTLGCLPVFAQTNMPPINEPDYNKPKIFADLPERLTLRLPELEALLSLPVGAQVNATVATGFLLAGTVVSKSAQANASSQSIIIKSSSRGGAVFTFTRRQATGGTFSYIGRMLGKGASDALEIVKENATYVLRKKSYYDLMNE
ncbi:MAG TPA: hypothetical protein VM871_11970 [Flavisolibacter sp.]|nr:hypothetical protein [Flavisolibacter sp.]